MKVFTTTGKWKPLLLLVIQKKNYITSLPQERRKGKNHDRCAKHTKSTTIKGSRVSV